VLPNEVMASDVITCHDRMRARIYLLVPSMAPAPDKKAKKKSDEEEEAPKLPEGLSVMKELPRGLNFAWDRFTAAVAAHEEVRDARATGLADKALQAESESEKAVANAESDESWRTMEKWTASVAGLREDGRQPSPAEARWLYAQLFPAETGLKFIRYRPDVQWDEMKTRMRTLATERGKAVIDGFGGQRHHSQLLASHERFAKAYGCSEVDDEAEVRTDTRPEGQVARDALRDLVFKIEAYADPADPQSELLAKFLLRPYERLMKNVESARKGTKKPAASADKPADPAKNGPEAPPPPKG
jgi:hypothetical protein